MRYQPNWSKSEESYKQGSGEVPKVVTQRTAPTLNRDEFESLRAIGNAMHRFVTPGHRDLFIAFGYVAAVDDGLRLTDAAAGDWRLECNFFDLRC